MLVYGHRGSPRTHPENTAAGVAAAFGQGADGVEVDVRRAGDLLVCSHDPLAGGPVETLADVLGAARGRVVCEVKNVPGEPDFDAPVAATARLLTAALAGLGAGEVTVSSFDWYSVEVARDAGLRTAFLTPPGLALDACLAYVTEAGHAECHPHWSAVLEDAAAVGRAHDAGKAVVCWTVDDRDVALRLRDAGVDAVITNDVPALRGWLDDD
ncbi:MAG TPA: glycerophosphodiester phosphodiesterase [Mycobacteriales bacterium]|jgi:glycerophosphoryl diester phosphodiesterase